MPHAQYPREAEVAIRGLYSRIDTVKDETQPGWETGQQRHGLPLQKSAIGPLHKAVEDITALDSIQTSSNLSSLWPGLE